MLGFLRYKTSKEGSPEVLTDRGLGFDNAWTIFGDRPTAADLLHAAYLDLPATQALMQGFHGREPIQVSGAHHLLVRHGLSELNEATRFRQFLQVLNDLRIVAYSRKNQTMRIVAPLPVFEAREEATASVRIVERDRPYSNVRHLRETLRVCKDFIWWADPHFSKKSFEPLTDEADSTRIKEIRILSGPAQVEDAKSDYRRFRDELANAGISVEWRIVETRDRDWHDRFIVTRGTAWNVPPVNSLYKGDYSEITETQPPPFEIWWKKGTVVE